MSQLKRLVALALALVVLTLCSINSIAGQQAQLITRRQLNQNQNVAELLPGNFPQYLQSPFAGIETPSGQQQQQQQAADQQQPTRQVLMNEGEREQAGEQLVQLEQRSFIRRPPMSMGRNLSLGDPSDQAKLPTTKDQAAAKCMYEKRYFAKLDECLARKPYPTIGLPAFKNEDLLIKRGLNDKHGCVFILNNGLFKGYQIPLYSVDTDSQCLDAGSKLGLSMNFSNVTMSYLWTLRCLNKADQLLDDATLDGKTVEGSAYTSATQAGSTPMAVNRGRDAHSATSDSSVCVGSSQNFGFASLQLTGLEAQVELATDIYKNWRVTNVTVAMLSPSSLPSLSAATARSGAAEHQAEDSTTAHLPPGTNIKDYVFESLDGDELNWRYLHLFQNWSRNRMHTNFVEQYRRFLWISLQRCLSEASDRLPTKLVDVFASSQQF